MRTGIQAGETCVRCGAPAQRFLLRRKLLDSPREVLPVCLVCSPDVLHDLMAETPRVLKNVTGFWALPGPAERSPH
jgi:hypothetical protein